MKLNREKIAAGLALVIFVLGVYSFVITETQEQRALEIKLDPGDQSVLRSDPVSYDEKRGGKRNPFRMSSEWEEVEPPPLRLPPSEGDRQIRVTFGWVAEKAPSATLDYRAKPLRQSIEDMAAEKRETETGGGQ